MFVRWNLEINESEWYVKWNEVQEMWNLSLNIVASEGKWEVMRSSMYSSCSKVELDQKWNDSKIIMIFDAEWNL